MEQQGIYVGIDVAKARVDVAIRPKLKPRWDAQMVGVKRRCRIVLQGRMKGIHQRNPADHHRHLNVHPTLVLV